MTVPEQEPQRHLGYLIRRAQQAHVAEWARTVSTEISSVQYSILAILEQQGAASQRELCDAIDLDRSTIADLVRRMERRGLVARERAADDARRNTVTLTEHGLAERWRLQPLVEEANARLTASLDPADRAALRSALTTLLDSQGE